MLDSKKDAQNASIVEAQNAAKELLERNTGFEEVIPILAKYNKRKYNVMKLLEELSELSEVLLKTETKIPEKRPDPQLIIEEIGDVFLRLGIYMEMQDGGTEEIMDKVEERINYKANKLLLYVAEGKYPGGV